MTHDTMQPAPRDGGPKGTMLHSGRHGPQLVTTRGHRWSEEAETVFLDHLAATANITASAKACGFSAQALYARRRTDPASQQRWDVALATKDALILLGHHRRTIEGGPRSRRQWARPRTLDEMRDSILCKLEAIAPTGDASVETPDD